MSLPKNYRPIALLETLSKLLEKVITTRLTFEAGKHTLIPHSQFGGRDITSCTDAGICMIHDIKTHWKSNHRVSSPLDVSGYFNNGPQQTYIHLRPHGILQPDLQLAQVISQPQNRAVQG
ncbi:Reverse transcriptase (RNA-dependent DNA polymerase) [Rhizoctonia solani]|uniref:Reverse transcriptase (RNA-dependent DNA polymerase) n=1 Tax=Rhizoctonia solani TaxID=456999 RepID=A0A8H8P4U3_9AGAM|nr:Reverse transcriptase (RNA-dependent DNA polymerase) [Rhizoctonia solani]QRW25175.1 Reverse transcriptase (RNA-dependent DNA polymerase) [Rhizoctonia solani]